MTKTVRKRRTSEQARSDIIEAAERILMEDGPTELKIQKIANEAGMSLSTAHHHFGGVAEIQTSLIERMLERLAADLMRSLLDVDDGDEEASAAQAIRSAYSIIASERYAKLIAWLVLSTNLEEHIDLKTPLRAIEALVATRLERHFAASEARKSSARIIYQTAISAVGEGLIGTLVRTSLKDLPKDYSGEEEMVAKIVDIIPPKSED